MPRLPPLGDISNEISNETQMKAKWATLKNPIVMRSFNPFLCALFIRISDPLVSWTAHMLRPAEKNWHISTHKMRLRLELNRFRNEWEKKTLNFFLDLILILMLTLNFRFPLVLTLVQSESQMLLCYVSMLIWMRYCSKKKSIYTFFLCHYSYLTGRYWYSPPTHW